MNINFNQISFQQVKNDLLAKLTSLFSQLTPLQRKVTLLATAILSGLALSGIIYQCLKRNVHPIQPTGLSLSENTVEEEEEESGHAEEELENAKAELVSIEQEVEQQRKQSEALEESIRQTSERVEKTKAEHEQSKKKMEGLRREIGETAKALADFREEIEQLKKSAVKAGDLANQEELMLTQVEQQEREEELAEVETEIALLQSQTFSDDQTKLKQQAAARTQKLQEIEEELQKMERERAGFQKKTSEQRDQWREKEEIRIQQEELLEQSRQKLVGAQKELEATTQKVGAVQKEILLKESEIEDRISQLDDSRKAIFEKNRERMGFVERADQNSAQLKSVREELVSVQKEVEKALKELSSNQESLGLAKQKKQEIYPKKVKESEEELAKARKDLEKTDKSLEETHQKIVNCQVQTPVPSAEYIRLEKEWQASKKSVSDAELALTKEQASWGAASEKLKAKNKDKEVLDQVLKEHEALKEKFGSYKELSKKEELVQLIASTKREIVSGKSNVLSLRSTKQDLDQLETSLIGLTKQARKLGQAMPQFLKPETSSILQKQYTQTKDAISQISAKLASNKTLEKPLLEDTLAKSSAKKSVAARLKKNLDFAEKQREAEDRAKKEQQKPKFKISKGEIPAKICGCYDLNYRKEMLVNGKTVGIASSQGRRDTMEDEDLAVNSSFKISEKTYDIDVFGIFDGHGGSTASAFAKKELLNYLIKALKTHNSTGLTDEGIFKAFKEAFVDLDKNYSGSAGSTAAVAVVLNGKVWFLNVGDSRIIRAKKGSVLQLTEDAKPNIDRYKTKVEKLGGHVIHMGVWRVAGDGGSGMAMASARAIGDKDVLTENEVRLISPKPKITCFPVTELEEGDRLILACDGLFDVATSNEVWEATQEMDKNKENTVDMARRFVQSAIENGSTDNVSVMVVKF